MPDQLNGGSDKEDELLGKLIRSARDEKAEFVRPNDDDILAYLTGTATEDQQNEVKRALVESTAFREEIVGLTQDIESLQALEPSESEDEAEAIVAPDLSAFLGRHTDEADETDQVIQPRPTHFKSRGILAWLFAPRHLVPIGTAGAAAVAVLLVLQNMIWVGTAVLDWSLSELKVDRGYLMQNVTRGSVQPEPCSTAKEAAYATLRNMLEPSRGGFNIRPADEWPAIEQETRVVLLRHVDEDGNTLRDFHLQAPAMAGAENELTAWLYVPASGSLYELPISEDVTHVSHASLPTQDACLALTYRTPDGYESIPGVQVPED